MNKRANFLYLEEISACTGFYRLCMKIFIHAHDLIDCECKNICMHQHLSYVPADISACTNESSLVHAEMSACTIDRILCMQIYLHARASKLLYMKNYLHAQLWTPLCMQN